MPPVAISAAFDGGNILRVASEALGSGTVRLQIKADPYTELEKKAHLQWFSFRSCATLLEGEGGLVKYEIVNAGDVSYPSAWPGYEVCASTDRHRWSRVASTEYDAARGALSWEYDHTAAPGGIAYFAYFDPYSYERHLDLISRSAAAKGASVRSLGATLDGRELEVVEVGTGPLHAWVIGRQHPGEPQAEHFAEGLLSRLLGIPAYSPLGASASAQPASAPVDALAVALRRAFTFHVVPSMNPDGALRGHLRTNAGGANLNREWAPTSDERGTYDAPTLARSPEVYHVLNAMDATGVDAFLDVHGDEELPVAFGAGSEGCPNWGPRIKALQSAFVGAYARANPDFSRTIGYAPDEPGKSPPNICSNAIGNRFDCLSLTFEMPFKDNANNLSPHATYQGERCQALGASFLDALAYVAASLRGVDNPSFPLADDEYVAPTEDADAVAKFVREQRAKQLGEGQCA